ncbi:nucleotide exchange factor GrpE [Evansella cellulosilytica]|uniref:Protein GrpE n=1 Tax=Evansella cellulosilytica (strain ATCC 21833 / DSM 2522 / FERM P-1141 / JCM 9156 / N-4) TaxID=649639 RepID=E6TW27_EVAC2|nr:nucleotide exchange factor GrpE [Evansella cellulosilytica]ADU29850.1 GrpE protein [Evansella cellulosilytica DSM 2522]
MEQQNRTTHEEEQVDQQEVQDVEADVTETEGNKSEEVEEAQSPEQEVEQKLEETTNRLLRLQADYENFRRRTRQEREADAKYRSQRLVEELLPALDNFERALTVTPESEEAKSLIQGMEMIYRQLQDALKKEEVHPVETVGYPFDPHFHQAVMQVETDEYEKNIVVEELQKGYKLKDRVIRPAMVKVNG